MRKIVFLALFVTYLLAATAFAGGSFDPTLELPDVVVNSDDYGNGGG